MAPKAARTTLNALRALLLVSMVAALPLTSGWITVYVVAGIALLAAFGCCLFSWCCAPLGCVDDCNCDCGSEPCCGPCDCGDPCEGCDCADDGCDCGGGCGSGGSDGCGCAESIPPEAGLAVASAPLLLPASAKLPAHWLSHHPNTPAYSEDCYHAAGLRLCIGCFTTYPVFVLASAYLALAATGGAWWIWLASGIGLASLQAVSSAGLARLRWQKSAVKAALGSGLAMAVHGILVAPWPLLGQQAALGGLLALALASSIPRSLRMRKGAGNA